MQNGSRAFLNEMSFLPPHLIWYSSTICRQSKVPVGRFMTSTSSQSSGRDTLTIHKVMCPSSSICRPVSVPSDKCCYRHNSPVHYNQKRLWRANCFRHTVVCPSAKHISSNLHCVTVSLQKHSVHDVVQTSKPQGSMGVSLSCWMSPILPGFPL